MANANGAVYYRIGLPSGQSYKATLNGDMAFFQDISPTKAGGDIIAYLREDRPHKYSLMVAAFIPAILMVALFYYDAKAKAKPPPPTVTYFESWPLSRSREDSLAAIMKRKAEKDAFVEEQRQGYKRLGRALGMDVDKIEQEATKIREDSLAAAKKAGERADTSGPVLTNQVGAKQ
jgi:hypothetical protein